VRSVKRGGEFRLMGSRPGEDGGEESTHVAGDEGGDGEGV